MKKFLFISILYRLFYYYRLYLLFRMKLSENQVIAIEKFKYGTNVLTQISAGKTDIEDMKECRCKLESTLQPLHT